LKGEVYLQTAVGLFFCKLIILKWVVHSHCRQGFFILFCVHKQSLSHYDILDAVVSGVLSSMKKYVFVLVATQVCIHRFSWTLWFYDISYQVPPSQYSSSSLSFQFGSAHSYTCQLWVSGWCSICYCMVNKLWPQVVCCLATAFSASCCSHNCPGQSIAAVLSLDLQNINVLEIKASYF
jgi:hypothetical protein